MQLIIAVIGYMALIALAWLLSENRRKFPMRIVVWGTFLQVLLAALILRTAPGQRLFELLSAGFNGLIAFSNEGSGLLFGDLHQNIFAFSVLPVIIFFSALTAVLYHLGIMQLLVSQIARLMQITLGTSGAESLSAASNIFVGQTEAPLMIRPYLARMTRSELMAVMVGGFSTIAGSVLAVYAGFGIDVAHLLTASVISAPAGLLIAKVLVPEEQTPETSSIGGATLEKSSGNLIEAIGNGTSDGLTLMLNVAAMLIAFLSIIALCDFCLGACSGWLFAEVFGKPEWGRITLSGILGFVFAPFAFLMGISSAECLAAGELLGLKIAATEFVAYQELGSILQQDPERFSPRTTTILTYALCGFSNFASIGIQVGGIGAMAPDRKRELSQLAVRAMIGGTLACCMTGSIAAILIYDLPF